MTTTNIDFADLEDAIVTRLLTSSSLTGKVFAITDPAGDITQLPSPPIVTVVATGAELVTSESQAIGRPLTRKVAVSIEVGIVSMYLRTRGDIPGVHDLGAIVKDLLFGWSPSLSIGRPMLFESESLYDHDEERRLVSWVQLWSVMIKLSEVTA